MREELKILIDLLDDNILHKVKFILLGVILHGKKNIWLLQWLSVKIIKRSDSNVWSRKNIKRFL